MKRLVLAASVLALAAGGAFAQGNNEQAPPMPPPAATPAPATPGVTPGIAPPAGAAPHHRRMAQSMRDIKAAQKALKEDGLYKGKIDGKFGPQTKAAVAEFQKQNDLKPTAKLDKETMSKLMAGGGGTAH